jgi:superfamily II DNA or RNA helicase
MPKALLRYDKGTVLIEGLEHIPYANFDPRINRLRAPALYYRNIVEYLNSSEVEFIDEVLDLIPSPKIQMANHITTREYQRRAVNNWLGAGKRGCIIMPTGAGKTIVGLSAIEQVNSSTIIVVPTIDLIHQWATAISTCLTDIKAGKLGGGEDDVEAITISTYDSAYSRVSKLGNRFSLIIFDEVHHLAAPGYRYIAEQFASPFRLGLTATIEREDGEQAELPRLVGGVVFDISPTNLAQDKHLAQYTIERRRIRMLPTEMKLYAESYKLYQSSLMKLGFRYGVSLQKLIMMSGRNGVAREALLARNKALRIALSSKSKIEELKTILEENRGLKTIIFTQHNSLVFEVSNRLLIPPITHKTNREERQEFLRGFKEGRYNALVTSKVLDEGIDVPDAELGIILSGTGSAREFIQRLGRLLRPRPASNKKARLIEIASADTQEIAMSVKRIKAIQSKSWQH